MYVPSTAAAPSHLSSSYLSSSLFFTSQATTTSIRTSTAPTSTSVQSSHTIIHNGLSSGAKATVGASCAVGALGIIGSLLVGLDRFRTRRKSNQATVVSGTRSTQHINQPLIGELENTERLIGLAGGERSMELH